MFTGHTHKPALSSIQFWSRFGKRTHKNVDLIAKSDGVDTNEPASPNVDKSVAYYRQRGGDPAACNRRLTCRRLQNTSLVCLTLALTNHRFL